MTLEWLPCQRLVISSLSFSLGLPDMVTNTRNFPFSIILNMVLDLPGLSVRSPEVLRVFCALGRLLLLGHHLSSTVPEDVQCSHHHDCKYPSREMGKPLQAYLRRPLPYGSLAAAADYVSCTCISFIKLGKSSVIVFSDRLN